MTTIIEIPLPCKLNQLYIPIRKGAYLGMALSPKGRSMKYEVLDSISTQLGKPEPYMNDCYVNIRWRNGTKHRHDIDGIIKQLLDCLTESRIIDDDSLIKSMTVELEPVAKPARCIIEIGEL